MKKNITDYLVDSFIDFEGKEHKVVICALSSSPEDKDCYKFRAAWTCDTENDFDTDSYYTDIYRILSIGISICNPCDEFDEEKGKKIALNKAYENEPKLFSSCSGVINTTLVRAFLRQEMEHLKKYPEKFIKGYNRAKAKYEYKKEAEELLRNLDSTEAEVVQALVDGVDIDKCQFLSDYIKNAKKNI